MEKKSLLIVDDVELFLQLEISYLGRDNFDIHTARSGSEALEKARSLMPDLILLDLFMPDMNGDEVCRRLKEDPRTSSIPIVIISSGSKQRSRVDTTDAGCDGLIFKPVRRDVLLSIVEEHLGISIRRWDRATLTIPCAVEYEGEHFDSNILSLSAEGAFIEMDLQNVTGDILQISFTLPGTDIHVEVRSGVLIWTGKLDEAGPEGIGIRFLNLNRKTLEEIDSLVKNLTEGSETEAISK